MVQQISGGIGPSGSAKLTVVKSDEYDPAKWPRERLLNPAPATPRIVPAPLEWRIRNGARVAAQTAKIKTAQYIAHKMGVGTVVSRLQAVVRHNDRCVVCQQPGYVHDEAQWAANPWMPSRYEQPGHPFIAPPDFWIEDYGTVGRRVVTTAGVNFIVDAFQNSVEVENFKYHGWGTGGTAEAAGDTALVTELTTQYATDNTRPTGSQTEGASANIYRTVGTLDPDAAVAITEHGVFTQAATGGGTLLDRTLFSVINVAASGDTLETTYEITIAAGG